MKIYIIYDEVGKEFYPVFQQPNDKACAMSFTENDKLISRFERLRVACIGYIDYSKSDDGYEQNLIVDSEFKLERLDSFLIRNGVLEKDIKE